MLIIQRVANKNALTSDSIAPGTVRSFKARTREESASGSDPLPSGDPMNSVGGRGVDFSGELGIGVIDSHGERI